MSTFLLFGLALTALFAVAVSLKANSATEDLTRELHDLRAKLARATVDLSTLSHRLDSVEGDVAEFGRTDATPALPASTNDHADPRVYVQLVPDQPHDRVILSNRSGVVARNLSLHLEFADGHTPFLSEFGDTNFPVAILQQGVPYIVLADFRSGSDGPVPARLEWHEADGTSQVREFPLRW